MSYQFLNGTSAQLGYTVPFTSGTHWKIQDRRQLKNRHTKKTKHNAEKATTQNTAKENYPGSVATRPGNEVGLFYNARAHTEQKI